MQQTDKYKLNLIERDDAFSPDALNENTQKVEEVLHTHLTGETAAREEAVADLDARVTVLEAHKMVVGTYTGTGAAMTIHLGFTPQWVIVQDSSVRGGFHACASQYIPAIAENSTFDILKIVDGGFSVNSPDSSPRLNTITVKFTYLALA